MTVQHRDMRRDPTHRAASPWDASLSPCDVASTVLNRDTLLLQVGLRSVSLVRPCVCVCVCVCVHVLSACVCVCAHVHVLCACVCVCAHVHMLCACVRTCVRGCVCVEVRRRCVASNNPALTDLRSNKCVTHDVTLSTLNASRVATQNNSV